MRRLRRPGTVMLALILAWLSAASAAAGLAHPGDLAADAREAARAGAPLLILYAQADCHWCEQVRRDHLLPLQRDARAPLLMRQIDLDSDAALRDFAGRATTERAFAQAQGVRVTPTLITYGPDGRRLAAPLVGVRIPDYYGAYIERLIEDSRAALQARAQP